MQTLRSSMALPALRVFGLVFVMSVSTQAVSFKNPPIIPTSTDVAEIATADVNNDGKLDLIYIDGAGPQYALHVLIGKGDGTFTHGQDIGLPVGVCCALTVADVTGDGKPDILMAGFSVASSGQITVIVTTLVGNGDGTFQTAIQSSFQPNVSLYPLFRSAFAVGDINGDGKADLALMDRQNEFIYTFLGDNTGKFVPGVTVQSFTRDAVYLLDLNGDAHLDILTTDSMGAQFEVLLGKGDGTFSNYVRYTPGTPAGPFFVADVDGDGRPDVLTLFYQANSPTQIGYFKGNPDGTFSSLISVGVSPSQGNQPVSAMDLNSDGIPDLTFLTPSGIAVSLGGSGPSFGAPLTTISGGSTSPYSTLPTILVAGDFNTDGHLDLAVAVEGGIELLFGKGDGTFASADFYDLNHTVGGAAVADFNGDTFPDIAVTVAATFPRLLLGDGSGKFTLAPDPNTSYSLPGADATLLAADFNGDGKPDLNLGNMVLNQSSAATQSIAYNLGNDLFSIPASIPNSSPVLADFNGDGRMDMLQLSGQQVIVSLGQSNNTFVTAMTTLHLGAVSGFFNVGDVNHDGKPDLVLNYFDHLEVWFGNGDGTFTYSSSINIQNVVNDAVAVVGDVDGDGNGDIILAPDPNPAGRFGPLAIFYGKGDGTFQAPVYLPISRRYSQITVADLNRDNKSDLIMTDGAAIAVMMNLGNRTFDSEVNFVAGRAISALNVVDVNSDGYPDIVVANPGGTTVTVLLNQPNATSSQGTPVNGKLSVAPEPSIGAQPFTITLTVSSQISGGTTPTGTVGFSVDGEFLADVPLANGSASYTFTGTLIPIQHTVTATYNGDSNYASRSFSVSHTVSPPTYATQTVLTAAPSTILASQTVRLSAVVTSAVSVPAGVVTFLDGSASIGSATIDSADTAHFDTALLAPGVHSLAATFQGLTENGFNGGTSSYVAAIFSASTSSPTTIVVNADATSTTLSSSAMSPTAGTVVTFTANVGSASGVPFGGATLYDGSSILGTSSLKADGTSTFSTASLSTGAHSITAAFNANGPFAGSTSAPVSISVLAAPASMLATLVSLAPEMNPADSSSTLVATVSSLKGSPAGTVTFLDGGTILGTAVTDLASNAVLRVGTLGSGIHNFTASFSGGPEFCPSVSPALYNLWPETGPGFTMTLGSKTLSVTRVGSESLQVRIEPLPGFGQQVQLSCASGLPEGYTCLFSPNTLNGKGISTLKIGRMTKTEGHSGKAPTNGLTFGLFTLALLGSLARRSRGLLLLMILCSLGLISGCGTASSSGDSTQRLVLTIRAESATGPDTIVHSTQVTLIMPTSK